MDELCPYNPQDRFWIMFTTKDTRQRPLWCDKITKRKDEDNDSSETQPQSIPF